MWFLLIGRLNCTVGRRVARATKGGVVFITLVSIFWCLAERWLNDKENTPRPQPIRTARSRLETQSSLLLRHVHFLQLVLAVFVHRLPSSLLLRNKREWHGSSRSFASCSSIQRALPKMCRVATDLLSYYVSAPVKSIAPNITGSFSVRFVLQGQRTKRSHLHLRHHARLGQGQIC